jgi:hypothetical protein
MNYVKLLNDLIFYPTDLDEKSIGKLESKDISFLIELKKSLNRLDLEDCN